jgi:hypothetical protein
VFTAQVPLATWNFELIYRVLNSFNVAFFAHPMVTTIAREMEHPTRFRLLGSTYLANVLCGICVFLIPAFGCMTMSEADDAAHIFHSLDPKAPEVIIGMFAVIVCMFCSNCLWTFFGAKTLVDTIYRPAQNHRLSVVAAAVVMASLSICVNFWGDSGVELFYTLGIMAFSIVVGTARHGRFSA